MVSHIRYSEQRCSSAASCLETIATFLERGWWLSRIARSNGMYVATFGIEQPPAAAESER